MSKPYVLFVLLLFYSCLDTAPSKKIETAKPEIPQKRQMIITQLGQTENNIYFSINGFDANTPSSYKQLRRFITENKGAFVPPCVMHFLDSVPDFQPPLSGKLYGTEAIRSRVICQYLFSHESSVDIFWDPFGEGKYAEKQ